MLKKGMITKGKSDVNRAGNRVGTGVKYIVETIQDEVHAKVIVTNRDNEEVLIGYCVLKKRFSLITKLVKGLKKSEVKIIKEPIVVEHNVLPEGIDSKVTIKQPHIIDMVEYKKSYEDLRKDKLQDFFRLLEKYELNCEYKIKVKKGIIIAELIPTKEMGDKEHIIEIYIEENLYIYYYNGKVRKTTDNLEKIFK